MPREAIRAVFDGMSVRVASKQLCVPRSTLSKRVKNQFPANPGGQTVFTKFKEDVFVSMVNGFA